MIDVMLVAGVVAAVKLGDLVSVDAGPGVVVYAAMVALSLVAGATFDPQAMWAGEESHA
jgi:paraquat-inducible protein A